MLTVEINKLGHQNEEQRKNIEYLEKELVKKHNQLERMKALEDIFNNGEYEEFQRAKLESPQSDLVREKVDKDTFENQSKMGAEEHNEQWISASAKSGF